MSIQENGRGAVRAAVWAAAAAALGSALLAGCGGGEPKGPVIGNQTMDSFFIAQEKMLEFVYYDHRVTLYCGAEFGARNRIEYPDGFTVSRHPERARVIEWGHVVPVENFGKTFTEWREGAPACEDENGTFKGRRCANAANREFRFMQADMYNLYPVIGSVNGVRGNLAFQMVPRAVPSAFGSCRLRVWGNKVEPPERARGQIARAYLYMDETYPHFTMGDEQRKVMEAWNRQYPVTSWECMRADRIRAVQGNANRFVEEPCRTVSRN